ncbi:hypothetical protein [Dysosmobacter sp.]|uniref:hypothetical protein n=1 Tax=Dysosmobacter sp. TaxID=2591382 RepID=UPI003D8F878A
MDDFSGGVLKTRSAESGLPSAIFRRQAASQCMRNMNQSGNAEYDIIVQTAQKREGGIGMTVHCIWAKSLLFLKISG